MDADDRRTAPRVFSGRRRKRNAGGPRPHRTVIRHTDEEWARVQAMAEHLGVSVPGLYERAAFAGSAQSAVGLQEVVLGMLGARRLLANAANNLNQLAKAANVDGSFEADRFVATQRLFENAIAVLSEEIDQLHRFIPEPTSRDEAP